MRMNKMFIKLKTRYDRKLKIEKIIKNKYLYDIDLTKCKSVIIGKGEWKYQICNVCFIENMVNLTLLCISNNELPYINVKNNEGENLWELYFEQPFYSIQPDNADNCSEINAVFGIPHFFESTNEIFKYNRVYSRLLKPNKRTQAYFDEDLSRTIPKNKKVLGVLYRGTDYKSQDLKYHPIQPSVEQLMDRIKVFSKTFHFDFIYLATEEKQARDMFVNEFGPIILENKRSYFDEHFYNQKKNTGISATILQNYDDPNRKILEYLSSINILSKCNYLLAGSCGGSRLAIVLNGGNYEMFELMNFGYNE